MLVADHSTPHRVAWTYLSEIPNIVKHPAAGEDWIQLYACPLIYFHIVFPLHFSHLKAIY